MPSLHQAADSSQCGLRFLLPTRQYGLLLQTLLAELDLVAHLVLPAAAVLAEHLAPEPCEHQLAWLRFCTLALLS